MQNHSLYRLSEVDLFDLYFVMSPEDIAKEFGERAPSSRTIRNIYKRMGMPTLTKAIREAIEEEEVPLVAYRSLSENEKAVRAALKNERSIHVSMVWDRIRAFEDGL